MEKVFKVMLGFTICFAVLYVIDKYETKQMMDSINELIVVPVSELDKVSITKYPSMESYMSFDYTEVQDTYRVLSKPELKVAKRLEISGNYIKIRFSEDGSQRYIEYIVYDNGYISRTEDAISVYKNASYQMDEEALHAMLESLLAGKTLD